MNKNIRKRITSKVKGIASVEIIVPLVHREDAEGKKQWLATTRSNQEDQASGEDFPLVEHMSPREKWIGRVRNRQTTILNATYRGIRQELFNDSKLSKSLMADLYPLKGAWWYPFEATLKLGSRKLKLPANIYGVVLKQKEYETKFSLNEKEIRDVKWLGPDGVKKNVKPQVLQYVPSNCHSELEKIIEETLYGDLNFGNHTLSLSSPGVVPAEYLVFIPTSSLKYSPIVHAFPGDYSYRRIST
jgi:hypothetical protein